MKLKEKRQIVLLSGIILCFAVGLWVVTTQFGHTFLGFVLLGIGTMLLCYEILNHFVHKGSHAANILRRILSWLLVCMVIPAAVIGTMIFIAIFGDNEAGLSYIVVLGAGVNGTTPSLSLTDRLNAALQYLEENPDTVCIVSGSQGRNEDISEAECMFRYLSDHGISEDRIWKEEKACSTRENIRFSLELIEQRTGSRPEKLGIVTSEYHIFRAKQFAKELQVTPFGIPGKTSWITLKINYFLREIAAVSYYFILGG